MASISAVGAPVTKQFAYARSESHTRGGAVRAQAPLRACFRKGAQPVSRSAFQSTGSSHSLRRSSAIKASEDAATPVPSIKLPAVREIPRFLTQDSAPPSCCAPTLSLV
eukprot:1181408-Prorocentrum_minimum.AAC.3